jgi:hypothetical protein
LLAYVSYQIRNYILNIIFKYVIGSGVLKIRPKIRVETGEKARERGRRLKGLCENIALTGI